VTVTDVAEAARLCWRARALKCSSWAHGSRCQASVV
jgi:hypothetical protein